MRKNILITLIFFLAISCIQCGNPPIGVDRVAYNMKVWNNSNYIVNYNLSFAFPDTSIQSRTKIWEGTGTNELSGIRENDFTKESSSLKWDKTFEKNNATKLSFFFFSPDTISKYGWEDVRSNYRVLKRKDFTLQELKDQNYTVSYP